MPLDELKSALTEFVSFARTLRGDEKSEAQSFLDRLFRALGHEGVIEAGATFEFRVAKKPGSSQLELVVVGIGDPGHRPRGGKKFADLLWPGRVLIEMKSRGTNLEKHYDQIFEYWTHIVPKRPPYVILCNFDEFWIYDFNLQLFDPVDRVSLGKLPESLSAFSFLLPHPKQPIFDNNRVEVTRRAADTMARVFKEIVFRGEPRERAQRFILQLLVSMVAEDIGLLPREIVTELLYECSEKGGNSYDLFGGLFRQMATKEPARGGRFQDIQYFNSGLFEIVDPIELKRKEVYALYEAGKEDWSKIRRKSSAPSSRTAWIRKSATPSARISRASSTFAKSSVLQSLGHGAIASKRRAKTSASCAEPLPICASSASSIPRAARATSSSSPIAR